MAVGTIPYDQYYGFSKPDRNVNQQRRFRTRARQLVPRLHLLRRGQAVALDCEGVILPNESGEKKLGLGRVSIVNEAGQVLYDTFAHYPEGVPHYPPKRELNLGVRRADIRPEVSSSIPFLSTLDLANISSIERSSAPR